MRRNKESTSTVESLHGQFSVLSALLTPFKLKIYNYSHRHHCESVVHSGSIIDIIIPKNCFIVLHCALVHWWTPWFVQSKVYHTKTRPFFSIAEKDYIDENEK